MSVATIGECQAFMGKIFEGFAHIMGSKSSSKLKGAATMVQETYLMRYQDEATWLKERHLNEYQVEMLDTELDRMQDDIDNFEFSVYRSSVVAQTPPSWSANEWSTNFFLLFKKYYAGYLDIYRKLAYWTSSEGKRDWLKSCSRKALSDCGPPCHVSPRISLRGKPVEFLGSKCTFSTARIPPEKTIEATAQKTRETPHAKTHPV